MRVTILLGILAILFVSESKSGCAQDLQVQDLLNTSLAAAGQVLKKHSVNQPYQDCWSSICGVQGNHSCTRCQAKLRPVEETYSDVLHASNIQVVGVPVITYGAPQVSAIPSGMHIETFDGTNCGTTPQTASTNLSVTVSTSESVTVTNGVSTGQTISAGITFSYTPPTSGVTIGSNVSFSTTQTVSISHGNTTSKDTSVTRSDTTNKTIAPMKELFAQMRVIEESLIVPFTASVVVDGDVDTNLNGYRKLSDVLPVSLRTFPARGVISMTAASDAHVEYHERALKDADCPDPQSGLKVARLANEAPWPLSVPRGASPEGMVEVQTAGEEDVNATPVQAIPAEPTLVETLPGQTTRKIVREKLGLEADVPIVLHGSANLVADQQTPSFAASGDHQCQSDTDIGHMCHVSGIGYNDCNEAAIKLRADDCCPSTKMCSADPQTGQLKCKLGGTSIGFIMGYCIPM